MPRSGRPLSNVTPDAHPLLREALPYVGHFVTRNRGTVGGSDRPRRRLGRAPALPRGARRQRRRGRAGRTARDRTGRLLRHALPDDACPGGARRRDDPGRSEAADEGSAFEELAAARRRLRARDGRGRAPTCRRRRPGGAHPGRRGDRPPHGARRGGGGRRRDSRLSEARHGRPARSPPRRSTRPARSTPRPGTSATSPARSSNGRSCAPGSGRDDRDHADGQRPHGGASTSSRGCS